MHQDCSVDFRQIIKHIPYYPIIYKPISYISNEQHLLYFVLFNILIQSILTKQIHYTDIFEAMTDML